MSIASSKTVPAPTTFCREKAGGGAGTDKEAASWSAGLFWGSDRCPVALDTGFCGANYRFVDSVSMTLVT